MTRPLPFLAGLATGALCGASLALWLNVRTAPVVPPAELEALRTGQARAEERLRELERRAGVCESGVGRAGERLDAVEAEVGVTGR